MQLLCRNDDLTYFLGEKKNVVYGSCKRLWFWVDGRLPSEGESRRAQRRAGWGRLGTKLPGPRAHHLRRLAEQPCGLGAHGKNRHEICTKNAWEKGH